jgi:hypothetical protein
MSTDNTASTDAKPQPEQPAPQIRYVPEPGTPAGDELAAWYDRKTFTGD